MGVTTNLNRWRESITDSCSKADRESSRRLGPHVRGNNCAEPCQIKKKIVPTEEETHDRQIMRANGQHMHIQRNMKEQFTGFRRLVHRARRGKEQGM